MKLLIIGAGGHGKVVKEIAEALGTYEEINFIDDNMAATQAIARIRDLESFVGKCEDCIIALGNNHLRSGLYGHIEELGFNIPTLIHPRAYVAPSAEIGSGTVVEANAVVSSNSVIGKGCILSVGAIVDHNAVVDDFAHIDCGAVVMADARVSRGTRLESCTFAKGGVVTSSITPNLGNDSDETWIRDYILQTGEEPSFF